MASNGDEEEKTLPSLAAASQSWNWLGLSQKSSTARGAASDRGNSTQNTSQHKRPLLLHRPSQTQDNNAKVTRENEKFTNRPSKKTDNPPSSDNTPVEEYSGLRIADRTVSESELRSEMEGRKFIQLQQMDQVPKDTFTNGEIDWVTIGVLTRKTLSKPAANGSTFMVWGLSDLDGTELGVFLFGDAYAAHWKEVAGSVVAVLNASLLPATEKNKFAFKASQPFEIVKLGTAVDFGICKGTTSGEARCRLAVNTAKAQYCLHHITANFMQAGRGRQQLNNSTGSLRKALFAGLTKPKNLSAGVYTSAPSSSKNSGWNPIFTKKLVQRTRPSQSAIASSGADTRRRGSMSLMDQIRQPAASMNSVPTNRAGAIASSQNQRASRGQKIM
ncbi:minichromosome maintenance- protein [Phytophthora boehmeriae]|uniref:Minichromosome maintenance- protein n=1 Tax=Phytophthora boehmeriae TaxID=109152 RepID=A0A8T1WLM6_9STRA|nr:minichromosome maintenance- protein [Phytophthora boehmeriae]